MMFEYHGLKQATNLRLHLEISNQVIEIGPAEPAFLNQVIQLIFHVVNHPIARIGLRSKDSDRSVSLSHSKVIFKIHNILLMFFSLLV